MRKTLPNDTGRVLILLRSGGGPAIFGPAATLLARRLCWGMGAGVLIWIACRNRGTLQMSASL